MDFLFIYLLKSSLSLSLLFLSYEFFFRKEAYFKFSRSLLLSILFLVSLLPLIPYNATPVASLPTVNLNEVIVKANMTTVMLDEIVIMANAPWFNFIHHISLASVLLFVYFFGVAIKFIQFLMRLAQLYLLIHKSNSEHKEGLKFVFTSSGTPTYSFLNWLFIDPDLLKNEKDYGAILNHEKIHARQKHSIDLILSEITTIIQWFNPFAYLLKKRIKENHEYLADFEVINQFQDIKKYQEMLFYHSTKQHTPILTHSFSYSFLKRRLHIMKKTKNPFSFSLRLALLSSIFALIFFACSSPAEKTEATPEEKVLTVTALDTNVQDSTITDGDPVFMVVEEMPVFKGGEAAMYKYIGSKIKYPASAKKAGTEGRVFLSFIIEKDGKVSSVEVLRGIGNGCDEEAKRVIESMPDWTPGKQRGQAVRVQYKMPIKFALQ